MIDDLQHRHSNFQIDHFILAAGGLTAYGRYQQCLRELYARLTMLPRDRSPDLLREIRRLWCHAVGLRTEIGPMDAKRRDELDRETWLHRVKCMAAVDIIATGGVSKSTVDMLITIPGELRRGLLADIRNPAALTDWFFAQEPPQYPLTAELSDAEMGRLLAYMQESQLPEPPKMPCIEHRHNGR